MIKQALLLSGGIDSIALAYWKRPTIAFTINYGQKAATAEIQSSETICRELSIRHEVINANCASIGVGCMADNLSTSTTPVPTPEWWPFRNQLLITIAASRAVVMGLDQIMIGSVVTDSRHRDGTPEFISKMSAVIAMQEGGIELIAPSIKMTSGDLIKKSKIPITLLAWAHSCHTGNLACGKCPGCIKHNDIWNELSL